MKIGYYVHHHGHGHLARALAIAARAPGEFTLIGTGLAGRYGAIDILDLPDDRLADADFDGRDGETDRLRSLHYAPLDHPGVRDRMAMIANWIASARPALMVVDVSVEIAMLARLLSVPTVYVRLAGRRDDLPHAEAFRGARALLCPFHGELDSPDLPRWITARSHHFPGLSGRAATVAVESDLIVAVFGRGGRPGNGEALAALARSLPKRRVEVLGPILLPGDMPANLHVRGWIEDAEERVASAGLVIGSAGDGVVNAVIAAGRPFVCLPQERPFDEQFEKARRLDKLGAAVVLGEWPQDWTPVIAEAESRAPRLRKLHDPHGPERAAAFLLQTAGRSPQRGNQEMAWPIANT